MFLLSLILTYDIRLELSPDPTSSRSYCLLQLHEVCSAIGMTLSPVRPFVRPHYTLVSYQPTEDKTFHGVREIYVCLWPSVLWQNDTSYSKRVWISERKCPYGNTILQLSTHRLYPLNLLPLEPSRWCRLTNTLKHTENKRTAKIPTSGIAVVSMLHDYSRQRRTIGSFSATAELHVITYICSKCHAVHSGCRDLLVRLPAGSLSGDSFFGHCCLRQYNLVLALFCGWDGNAQNPVHIHFPVT